VLDLVTVEEDRFAHLLRDPEPATLAPAIRGAQEAPRDADQPHQQDRTQSEHVHYLPVIASTELNYEPRHPSQRAQGISRYAR